MKGEIDDDYSFRIRRLRSVVGVVVGIGIVSPE
jgi:hypothetical protein